MTLNARTTLTGVPPLSKSAWQRPGVVVLERQRRPGVKLPPSGVIGPAGWDLSAKDGLAPGRRHAREEASMPVVDPQNLAHGPDGTPLINRRGLAQASGLSLSRINHLLPAPALPPVDRAEAPPGGRGEWYRRWIDAEEYRQILGVTRDSMYAYIRDAHAPWEQGQASTYLARAIDPELVRAEIRAGRLRAGRGRQRLYWLLRDVVAHLAWRDETGNTHAGRPALEVTPNSLVSETWVRERVNEVRGTATGYRRFQKIKDQCELAWKRGEDGDDLPCPAMCAVSRAKDGRIRYQWRAGDVEAFLQG